MGEKPIASVVITTKNRKEELRMALSSVMQQSVRAEVIVMDDGSTDGTSNLVRSEFPDALLHQFHESKGLIVRRNEGARLAAGEIIFSIDDDAVFSTPQIIEQTLADFSDPRIGAVAIPYREMNKDRRIQQRAPDREKIWQTHTFIGTAHAVRKGIFLKLGGYREALVHQGEESDYCLRMLNAGYVVRLGRADPVDHFESPKRDFRRMDFYGCRNSILFAWQNVPAFPLPIYLLATTWNCLKWTLDPKRFPVRLMGIIAGYRDCLTSVRAPVESDTYRCWRHLKGNGPMPLQVNAAPASSHWICIQLGAREHYAVARAVQASGHLDALFTDAWATPGSLWGKLHRKFGERYHPDLALNSVTSCNTGLLGFELAARARNLKDWPLTMRRNKWFQHRAGRFLSSFQSKPASSKILFAYSYAALRPFQVARKLGWRTVLGQIDPGPVEERLVEKLHQQNEEMDSSWVPAPSEYWSLWQEECALADHILVNSAWSRTALVEEGIEEGKIAVIPLAFEAPEASLYFTRSYPSAFTWERPLRVLFLGQVNLRKGIAEILQAARLLQNSPIEFSIVGQLQVRIPLELRNDPRIHWIGRVARGSVNDHYQRADVFLFPTHSDGFGLTQLEAQAWKLPVIASRFCGEVVEQGRNGWLLPEVSGEAIAAQLTQCVEHPELLAAAANESGVAPQYTLSSVGKAFSSLVSIE